MTPPGYSWFLVAPAGRGLKIVGAFYRESSAQEFRHHIAGSIVVRKGDKEHDALITAYLREQAHPNDRVIVDTHQRRHRRKAT